MTDQPECPKCGVDAYIDALLADEAASDTVWEAWNNGELTDWEALWAWSVLVILSDRPKNGD